MTGEKRPGAFDQEFDRLLEAARFLADGLYDALAGTYANEFPASTVMRVVMASVPLYEAALASLSTPGSSLGVLALQRPLIENWLHLTFVVGEDDMADAPCRAMRMELGWANWTHQLVSAANDQAQVSQVAARVAEVTRLLTERDCVGDARDFRAVGRATKEAAVQYGWDWLPAAWQAASQVAHGSGWEWLAEGTPSGTNWRHPTDQHRAGWLNNVVLIFNNLAQTVFLILGFDLESGAPQQLFAEATRIVDHPLLASCHANRVTSHGTSVQR